MSQAYRWYLRSPQWRDKRARALADANHLCKVCGKPATEVHHRTYVRVFAEAPNDLMAVCSCCHRWIHSLRAANDNQLELPLADPHHQ